MSASDVNPSMGSIPSAPTNHPSRGGKKGQIHAMIRFLCFFGGTGDNRMHHFQRAIDIPRSSFLGHVYEPLRQSVDADQWLVARDYAVNCLKPYDQVEVS